MSDWHTRRPWVKGLPILGAIWLMGAVCDRLWFGLDHTVPAWDQSAHLMAALNYWRVFQTPQLFSSDWWIHLWQLSPKFPPLVYISTVPFISLFGAGADQSTLVNLPYSAILLGSVYALGTLLFSVTTGLWAAGFCLLMPGLYRIRLDFLLDHPLVAMVALCFACLTAWRESAPGHWRSTMGVPDTLGALETQTNWISRFGLQQWGLAIAIGISFGLALMIKQPAVLFLILPMLWVTAETLRQRAWGRFAQLLLAACISIPIFYPWYRTNWLLILSSSKRATVDSAIAEGDSPLWSLNAWTYYLKLLPELVSLPLLLVPLIGFLFFWRRSRVSSQPFGEPDHSPKPKAYQQQIYRRSQRSLLWLLVFWGGSYVLSSLNLNKSDRYVAAYLPILAVLLAYGITLLPKRWSALQWGTLGLSIVLTIGNLLPIGTFHLSTGSLAQHHACLAEDYPHAQVIAAVIRAAPDLDANIGVIPSTPAINQHNIHYYGQIQNFQVYGRQVGTRLSHVVQDGRSLSWFLTKTGDQGSIRQVQAHDAIVQWIEQSRDFQIHKTWLLADRSRLNLYRRQIPPVEVITGKSVAVQKPPSNSATPQFSDVRLDHVSLPDKAPPGKPVPVTYTWSGDWSSLQSGLVILTWQNQKEQPVPVTGRWFHDHAIAMGTLHPSPDKKTMPTQVIERMAMLPPEAVVPGTYTLKATYVNRLTGESAAIATPAVTLKIDPEAVSTPAPELDLVTQFRNLARLLPDGVKALDRIFEDVGRISQYDPVQDYVSQTRQAMDYRLQLEPNNRDFAYALALANALKQRVDPAIAALQQVVRLDPQNPYAYAYLAVVNLYDFRPRAAQPALDRALALNPTIPELHELNAIAALMQGNLVHLWQEFKVYQGNGKQRNDRPQG